MSELRKHVLDKKPFIVTSAFSSTIKELTQEVQRAFGSNDLSKIHIDIQKQYSLRTAENDDKTKYHKIFYDKLRNGWFDFMFLYHRLIIEMKTNYHIKTPLVFQKTPSIRFHLPGNLAVGEFHSDSQYNHLDGELNVSVPLTDALSPRAILIQTATGPDGPLFTEMECELGELTIFNGNQLLHGNKINESDKTRISFDFRILTISDYERSAGVKLSFGQKMKFEMGEYYSGYTA
jgi:hypothetical protein